MVLFHLLKNTCCFSCWFQRKSIIIVGLLLFGFSNDQVPFGFKPRSRGTMDVPFVCHIPSIAHCDPMGQANALARSGFRPSGLQVVQVDGTIFRILVSPCPLPTQMGGIVPSKSPSVPSPMNMEPGEILAHVPFQPSSSVLVGGKATRM